MPLALIILTLVTASAAFALAYPDITITYLTNLSEFYTDRSKAAAHYWWSYKIFESDGEGLSNLRERVLHSGPALLAYKLLGKTPPSRSAAAFFENGQAISVPVLLYHGESDATYNIPLARFVEQMQALKDNGWHTITMDQLEGFLKRGEQVPDKSFLLTFDDGRKDSYYPTDPVLADMGYTATMFVVTGYSLPEDETKKQSTFYLSRTELEQMQESGRWELHSHGKEDHYFYTIDESNTEGHFLSNKLWLKDQGRLETEEEFRERILFDLSHSKNTLERMFGKPVTAFAFPFSDYGPSTENFKGSEPIIAEIVSSLYSMAFYQVVSPTGDTYEDTFNYPDPGRFMIKRIEPSPSWSGEELIAVLETGRPKSIPYEQTNFNTGGQWIETWGKVNPEMSGLHLRASDSSTGAATFLNGSAWWNNYTFAAAVDWQAGSNIMLVARYQDSKNYYFCAFSKDRVTVRQNSNGVVSTLLSKKYEGVVSKNPRLGISVQNNTVSCLINEEEVAEAVVSANRIKKGGIALQIWDEENGVAEITVREVSVQPVSN